MAHAAESQGEKPLAYTGENIYTHACVGRIVKETVSGVKWGLLQKCTLQPITLVYGIILARLLTPAETGIMGLTAIFFAVAGTLASAGFGSALIRKQDRTEADCSTMFWFNLGMSFLMGLILFLLAPWFASFYNQPELLWMTRISAVMMFVGSSASVHWTLYSARRDFKTPAIVGMVTTIVGLPVGLGFAYYGYGVWSLVIQGVVQSLLSLIVIWIISPWKPRFIWSNRSFKEMFGFGSKLAASGLLHTLYREIRTFIIGKFFMAAQLGLYSKAQHLVAMPPGTINGMLQSVTYPILATIQDDDARLTLVYRKYLRVSTLPIAWGMCLMMALGEPLVHLLYGENWMGCVIYLKILCMSYAFDHVCIINLNLLQVKGRSDLFLRLEIIKKSISIAMLLAAAFIFKSVEAICWTGAIYSQFAVYINSYYTGKLIGLTWWEQQKDYWPFLLLSIAACLPAYLLTFSPLPDFVQLALGGVTAVLLYFGILRRRQDETYLEFANIMAAKFPKLKGVLGV